MMIDGARRVGKSFIAEEFAKAEYKSYIMEQTKKWEDNEVNVIYTPKQLKEFEMWYNDFC